MTTPPTHLNHTIIYHETTDLWIYVSKRNGTNTCFRVWNNSTHTWDQSLLIIGKHFTGWLRLISRRPLEGLLLSVASLYSTWYLLAVKAPETLFAILPEKNPGKDSLFGQNYSNSKFLLLPVVESDCVYRKCKWKHFSSERQIVRSRGDPSELHCSLYILSDPLGFVLRLDQTHHK